MDRKKVLAVFILFGLVLSSGIVRAESEPSGEAKKGGVKRSEEGDYIIEKRSDGTTIKYKRKNTYDFEGADIEGLFKRPSGSYISNIKDVKGKSIIRIRQNFDPEVIDSVRLVK